MIFVCFLGICEFLSMVHRIICKYDEYKICAVEVILMKPNPIKIAMIRSAVKKGTRDIKDEPRRGARNLVELGEMFSTGQSQLSFFSLAMNQLADENSAYFRIVNQIVQTMDEETLLTFGINLGYHALIHGGGIIRCIEQREGFNVPWCLMIELGDGATLPSLDVNNIINQGKELGIYCYLLYVDANDPHLEQLFSMLHAQTDCAFLLFLHPSTLTDTALEALQGLHNAIPVLDMDEVSDDDLRRAIDRLSNVNCLAAGFTRQDKVASAQRSHEMLLYAEGIGLHSLVFLRTEKHRPSSEDDAYQRFVALRENLDIPVLPIDLYGDLAHANRAISADTCLALIRRNGSSTFFNVDRNEIVKGKNIQEFSLQEILEQAMPKHKPPLV